tara:strand:- start:402 stop:1397 length:996 start_codon:yes stop_codon:yes gene_type:complete
MSKIKVALTLGDPNGVGLEIILSVFEEKSIYNDLTPILFAPKKLVEFQKNYFKSKTSLNYIDDIQNIKDETLNVYEIICDDFKVRFGKQCPKAGFLSIESLKKSIELIESKMVDILITAPINKKSIQSKSFNFPGHTDYLNFKFEGNSLMFMISNSLRVALVTDHIPINKVSKTLSIELIELKINQVLSSLINDFGILKPRIAVLGLNPHAGDNGVIGKEDDCIVRPAIVKTKRINQEVNGPFAADSFFTSKKLKEYDAILAIYHDQGLIPFKTISFGNGVNFTAGLSLVRTSPDHGTAFDIAGLGIAKTNSYKIAILEAIKIFKTRNHLN